jgi:outer membrane receptor protein involved in Fe transport
MKNLARSQPMSPDRRAACLRRMAPGFALSALAAAAGTAWAQVAPPAAAASAPQSTAGRATEDSGAGTQTIVVSAQKRQQAAQTVPISLYSVSGLTLERSGVNSVEDLGNSVAGVTIGALNAGELNINIRGVADLSEAAENSSANGLYIDEAPLGGIPGAQPDFGLWDIERVEVLRGPQGTLFGEGSMGGTIRIITRKPDAKEFFGRVGFGGSRVAGGGTGYSASASFNLPIIAGELALTAAARRQRLPGWIDIPDLGLKDANRADKTDLRLALRWTPTRSLTVDASYIQSHIKAGDGGATSPGVLDPAGAFPGAGPVRARSERDNKSGVGNLTVNYDLGMATLTSSSTVFDQKVDRSIDNSFITPLFFGPAGVGASAFGLFPSKLKAFTQEVRLASNGNQNLNWTTGVYYRDANNDIPPTGYVISLPVAGLVDDKNLLSETHKVRAQAVFGEVEYKLTDTLSAQLGLRYYDEKKDARLEQSTSSLIFGTTAGTFSEGSHTAHATSPKLVLNWQASPDTLLFAKVSKGFRGGGANTLSPVLYPDAPRGFAPETLVAYELGMKSTPARGWYLNTYLYRNDWTDLQLAFVTADGLNGYTSNAGKAQSTGAEVEFGGRLMPGLNLGVSLAYIDAKITQSVFNVGGTLIAESGKRIPLTSRTKVGLTADYGFSLNDALRARITGRYRESSATYSDIANRDAERNDPGRQLYLRASVRSGAWEVGLWGDNLLSRDDSNFKRRPITRIPLVFTTYVPPRTVGVDFKLDF